MNSWHDRRILDLFGIDLPILQAPMAGVSTPEMAIAVSEAGGLGSLACAQLSVEQARKDLATIRAAHQAPDQRQLLLPHAAGAGAGAHRRLARAAGAATIASSASIPTRRSRHANRVPFDDGVLRLDRRGQAGGRELPFRTAGAGAARPRAGDRRQDPLVRHHRRRSALAGGARRATRSSPWASRPAAIAATSSPTTSACRSGTFALVPQVVDAVKVPVIAAGGITDARGIVAAFALGASAVQIGTAYMLTPRGQADGLAPQGAAQRRPTPHPAHEPVHRPAGARHGQSADARSRRDQSGRAQLPAGGRRAPAAQGQGRAVGIGRLHQPVVRPSRESLPGR